MSYDDRVCINMLTYNTCYVYIYMYISPTASPTNTIVVYYTSYKPAVGTGAYVVKILEP